MHVDVHAHWFPPDYVDLLRPDGFTESAAAALYDLDLDGRIEMLDRLGIDAQVLSLSLLQPYLPDPAGAAAAARLANDRYAETCERYPGRLYAFGTLPLPHVDESLAELARCLDELSMVGFGFGCSVAGRQLDDPQLDPVWAELDRRATTVFLHPMGGCQMDGTDAYGLDWSAGALFEDTVATLRLVRSGNRRRFPNVDVIVPHMGGTIPFTLQRVGGRQPEHLADLRSMWFDTCNDTPAALDCFCHGLGADRLLFGTDLPWGTEERYQWYQQRLDDAGVLTDDDRREIRGDRAARLLGLA